MNTDRGTRFKLYEYQKSCVDRVVNDDSVGLFLDMGLGKTLITLTSINELMYRRFEVGKVLIIAPKKVAEATWQDEINKWPHLKHLRVSTVMGTLKQREAALSVPADIYITNREQTKWIVDYLKTKWPFDMVVLDEFSSFKNHSSQRFKALKSIRPKIKKVVGLTGTPSPNGLLDLWAQVFLLDQGKRLGRSFHAYRSNFFTSDFMGYSYEPRKGADEEILERISDICVSMKSEDYLELPDMIKSYTTVKLDNKARKAYNILAKQQVMNVDTNTIEAVNAAALSNKLLQLANGAVYDEDREVIHIHDCKLDAFMEMVEGLNGKSALVFYSFKHDLDRLVEALDKTKLRYRLLSSSEDQKAWNNREVDVLLAHPSSCAYGLNLQAGGNYVIWYGLTWNLELYEQANKRLHRNGQTDKVIVHHLVVEDSRDEDVVKALESKNLTQDQVMESLKARINKIKGGELD